MDKGHECFPVFATYFLIERQDSYQKIETTGKQRYIAVTSELLANVSQTECLIQLFGFLQNVVSQDRPPAWPGGKLRG